VPRGRDDKGTRWDSQPHREPGCPSGPDRSAGANPTPVDAPTERPSGGGAAGSEAESARLEMEQIEMARVDLAPIDLAALDADDDLIEALAGGRLRADDLLPEPVGPDDELVALLAAWVADVNEPVAGGAAPAGSVAGPTGPGAEAVAPSGREPGPVPGLAEVRALPTGADRSSRRPRIVRAAARGRHRARTSPYATRLAAAAALVVVTSSGVLISAHDAHPGEALWTISKVFYGERARSVEAAAAADEALRAAHVALQEGRTADAAQAIAVAAAQLPLVRPTEGHDELAAEHQQLINDLEAVWDGLVAPTTADPAVGRRAVVPSSSALPLAAAPLTGTPTPGAAPTSAPAAVLAAPTGDATPTTAVDGAAVVAQTQAQTEGAVDAVAGAVQSAVDAATQLGAAGNHVIPPARINSANVPSTDTSSSAPTTPEPTTPPPDEVNSTDSAPDEPPPTTTAGTDQPVSGQTDAGTGTGSGSDTEAPTTPLDVVPPAPQPDPAPAAGDPAPGTSTDGAGDTPTNSETGTDTETGTSATPGTAVDAAADTVALPAVVPDATAPTEQLPAVGSTSTGRHAAPEASGSPDAPTDDPSAEPTGPSGRHAAAEPDVA
jgi:hypothetical protein